MMVKPASSSTHCLRRLRAQYPEWFGGHLSDKQLLLSSNKSINTSQQLYTMYMYMMYTYVHDRVQ